MILLKDCDYDNFIEILNYFDETPKRVPQTLMIDSAGGSMVPTTFFSHYLKRLVKKKLLEKVFVLDQCSSSALKIFFLFPKERRYIYEHSFFIFHMGSSPIYERADSKYLNTMSTMLHKLESSFYNDCYLSKEEKSKISELERKNTMITAKDIVSLGLVNKKNVIPEGKEYLIL